MTDNKDQPETNSESQVEDVKPPPEQFNPSLIQKATPEYLQELLMDKKTLQNFPNTFKHVDLILEKGGSFYVYFPFQNFFKPRVTICEYL